MARPQFRSTVTPKYGKGIIRHSPQLRGFREVSSETDDDAYTLTGIALTDTTTAWGQSDIKINGVEIYDADIATTSFQGKLDAINNFSEETGVVATAVIDHLFDFSAISFTAGELIFINGTSIAAGASIGEIGRAHV